MDFFTQKWINYINKEWDEYTNWIWYVKGSDNSKKKLEIYDGKYEDKLVEEFDKYYTAKKKYVEMAKELEEKFGDYEHVELKSYDEELNDYKKRVELYADELRKHFIDIAKEDEREKITKLDYKLLLLGYASKESFDSNLPRHYFNRNNNVDDIQIFNFANVFLSGQVDYDKYLLNFMSEEVVRMFLHDGEILQVKKDENKLTLLITGWGSGTCPIYVTFVNYSLNVDDTEIYLDNIINANWVFYRKGKVYYYLEFISGNILEIICDQVLVKRKCDNDHVGKKEFTNKDIKVVNKIKDDVPKFLSNSWYKYLENEWFRYISNPAYFDTRNPDNLKRYDGDYEEILLSEFDKYYDMKQQYVSKYEWFLEKFGEYEEIELKSETEEFEEYKKRVDEYASELKCRLKLWLGEENFKKIENCDFRLLLLGYVNSNTKMVVSWPKILNRANAFLSNRGREDYFKIINDYKVVDSELNDYCFNRTMIYKVEKKERELTLIIDPLYTDIFEPDVVEVYVTFKNIDTSKYDKYELVDTIYDTKVYFINNKYRYYIELNNGKVFEFVCDGITIEEKMK